MKCPQCGKPTQHPHRPFCSKRCADVDLAKWFDGTYTLAGDEDVSSDTDEPREDRRLH